ncbi:hypothetical protein ACWF9G_22955 [Nocardia sp. NPDC055029]
MFTDGQLSGLTALTDTGTAEFGLVRELVVDQAPQEVLIIGVAPMRSAPAIWQAAEALTAALAGIAATTTVYTESLCDTAPVIDLGATTNTNWRG